ncbi:ABC-transporter-regulating transcription factor [Podosphaera aphanis]|nr:ABC-transporter-regulating transcription factor [Podosphaera aphanis]
MENLLKVSGLLPVDDNGETDFNFIEEQPLDDLLKSQGKEVTPIESLSLSSQRSIRGRTESISQNFSDPMRADGNEIDTDERNEGSTMSDNSEGDIEAVSDMMGSLLTNECGESRYIGSSSGFSILSPKGIQWIKERTDEFSLQQIISRLGKNKWMYWQPDMVSDIFQRRVFQELPSKEECLSLLKDYFESFNSTFPLFHKPTFIHLVNRQYSQNPYNGSGWWACLNIALAIAHRHRTFDSVDPKGEENMARGYLKNVTAVYSELTISSTDLLSVQALLGMAMFICGTPNPHPTSFIVAAAIRSSHVIGLHKRGSGFNLNPIEIEQRKRVFWIGYMLEKEICLRSGLPSVQDDDDISVDLPGAHPDDDAGNILLSDSKTKFNFFRLMCEFATIESKVSKQLYSTKASKQSDRQLLKSIGELDHLIEEWKKRIPVDIRPGYEIKVKSPHMILKVAMVHLAYYNCLTTIHRMSIQHGYWTSRLSNHAIQGFNTDSLSPRIFLSATLCVSAARASIGLIRHVPQGDVPIAWLFPFFFAASLVTLFGNVLRNPQDPRARSDLQLMNLVVGFLTKLSLHEEYGDAKRLLGVCTEFRRVATAVIDKAERKNSRHKRKGPEDRRTSDISSNQTTSPSSPSNLNSSDSRILVSANELLPETAINDQSSSSIINYNSPNFLEATNNYILNDSGMFTNEMMMPSEDMLRCLNMNEINPPPMNNFDQIFMSQEFWQMPVIPEETGWSYQMDPNPSYYGKDSGDG